MYTWNPQSYSTPQDKNVRQSLAGRSRMSDLSAIPGTPSQGARVPSPLRERSSSSLLIQPSSSRGTAQHSQPARVLPTAPVASRSSVSSLLSPKYDDDIDHGFPSGEIGTVVLPSLSSGERVDLESADIYLEECIKKDQEKIDIADQLIGNNTGQQQPQFSSSGAHPDDYVPSDLSHFRVAKEWPMNEIVVQAMTENQSGYSSLGCFPDLAMIWAFVDTKLFIWPWEDQRKLTTIQYPEFITAVGLLPTWSPGLIRFGASYVVVVATVAEVLFTSVSSSERGYSFQTDNFVLRTPTNDQRFCSIQTTNAGRVFLGSVEGQVSELQNIKETVFTKYLWFGPRLANCTLAVYERIASAIPGFNLLFRKEPVIQMICDETRKIIYTLRKDNDVDLYDLGADGNASARHLHLSFQNIVSQALPYLRNVDKLQVKQIMSICLVDTWESTRYPFFLLTSAGLRLYFAFAPRGGANPDRPSGFFLGHIRFPPGHNPAAPVSQVSGHLSLCNSLYTDGTVMLVRTNDRDNEEEIISACNDLFVYEDKYRESVSVTSIPYHIESIMAVPQYPRDSLVLQPRSLVVNQLLTSRKLIVVLTMKKCFLLEKSYPVDIMEKMLRTHSPMSAQVRDFVEWLPLFQSCFLALHLACITTSTEIARLATRVLRAYGGEPVIEAEITPNARVRTVQQPHLRPPSPRPTIRYSPKHDAFYYLVGRITGPLWKLRPFVFGAQYKGAIAWISGIPAGDVPTIIEQLTLVKRYLDNNWNDLFYPGRSAGITGVPSEDTVTAIAVAKAELLSIKSLAGLIENSVQLLRLWEFVVQEGLSQVLDYVGRVYAKETLVPLTFCDLVVSSVGKSVVDSIIKSLHQRYVDEGASTDTIQQVSAYLREFCPKLFDNDDAIALSVMTTIDRIAAKADGAGVSMLESALDLVRPNATIVGLREILDRLIEHRFYEAAIELCCLAALQSDPQNYAVRFIINNEAIADAAGKTAMERRQRYYAFITDILSDLDGQSSNGTQQQRPDGRLKPAEARVKLEYVLDWIYSKSNDVLLHFSVFEWCFSSQLDQYGLASNSPYLKDYLLRKLTSLPPSDTEGRVRFLQLVADCAERGGDKWTAAQALSALALHETALIRITDRADYLQRVELLCRALDVRGNVPELSEFMSSIRVHYTLANVQREIYSYIQEKTFNVTADPDTLTKVTYELLNANKLFSLATEINAPQWTLVIMSICGEPPNIRIITHTWGKFLKNALEYAASNKRLSREACVTLIAEQILKIRSFLSASDPYCALSHIVEGLETQHAYLGQACLSDPTLVFDVVLQGLDQDIGDIMDIYHLLFGKYAADPVMAPHLLRIHSHVVKSLLENQQNKHLGTQQRRAILTKYKRHFDEYLKAAMRLQLADEDLLAEVQSTAQRLATSSSVHRS